METWQRGYESVCFVARYSFLYCRAGLDEAWTKCRCKSIWYPLAANFTSGLLALARGKLDHFRVTAHPQFLVLKVQVPMGTCPGQYSNCGSPPVKIECYSVVCFDRITVFEAL